MSYSISATVSVCRSQILDALEIAEAGELQQSEDGHGFYLTRQQVRAIVDKYETLTRTVFLPPWNTISLDHETLNLILVAQVLQADAERYILRASTMAPKEPKQRKEYLRQATRRYQVVLG